MFLTRKRVLLATLFPVLEIDVSFWCQLGPKDGDMAAASLMPSIPIIVFSAFTVEVTSCTEKCGKSTDYQRVVLGHINKFINEKIPDLRRKSSDQRPRVLAPQTKVNVVEESE